MERSESVLDLLALQQDTLLDPDGRWRIDERLLKQHYSSLVESDLEALLSLARSAERWKAKMKVRLLSDEVRIDIALKTDSPVRDRLSETPHYRLSAIFPRSHFLFEFAAGYNILAHSDLGRDVAVRMDEKKLFISWKFEESAELTEAIQTLLLQDTFLEHSIHITQVSSS
jgi:hypothetical protein